MQAQETILFVAVAVLSLALIVALVGPRLRGGQDRAKRGNPRSDAPIPVAPSTPAEAARPPPIRVASAAAEAPVPKVPAAVVTAPPPPPVPMTCPTCRRSFAAGLRYCPYDARLLTADLHQMQRSISPARVAALANPGKICPSCSRRYDAVALVCGRDGTALVAVN